MTKKIILGIFIFLQAQFLLFAQNSLIPADKPKLVVGIVVEQMRYDYLTRYWDKFSENGFKKMAIYGTSCQNTHLNYHITQVSPAYASIATGAEPAENGIVSDYWYVPLTGKKTLSTEDNNVKAVGIKSKNGNASPIQMLAPSFSDEIKLASKGKSKVVSLGLDKKGAILSAGFSANAAYWFCTETGQWITSSYYMKDLPEWVKSFNEKEYPQEYLTRTWTPLLPIEEYTASSCDTSIYEYGIDGLYKVFPYEYSEITKKVKNYKLINIIPEGNTLTTDFAVNALMNENLGKSENTDFLFVNYCVTENIGKLYGPDAMETQDIYLRLDKEIAHLLSVLEDRIGKNDVLIYLTSTSGVSQVPAYLQKNKLPAGIFKHHYITALLNSFIKATYSEGNWITDFANQQIYLNRLLVEDSKISLQEIQDKISGFIISSESVAYAIGGQNLATQTYTDGVRKKMQNSYHPKRSGDVMVALKPGWLYDISYSSDHSSGYAYDTHVPLLWYGWKVRKNIIYDPINITDIAPTISLMLQMPMPSHASGKPIMEM
ncbi:MAG: alkaline phosphatase family protein, partial [Bacteroidales bacterium]|nr:alkaline phosphatase family protein [Bacteroidales bacterium]